MRERLHLSSARRHRAIVRVATAFLPRARFPHRVARDAAASGTSRAPPRADATAVAIARLGASSRVGARARRRARRARRTASVRARIRRRGRAVTTPTRAPSVEASSYTDVTLYAHTTVHAVGRGTRGEGRPRAIPRAHARAKRRARCRATAISRTTRTPDARARRRNAPKAIASDDGDALNPLVPLRALDDETLATTRATRESDADARATVEDDVRAEEFAFAEALMRVKREGAGAGRGGGDVRRRVSVASAGTANASGGAKAASAERGEV